MAAEPNHHIAEMIQPRFRVYNVAHRGLVAVLVGFTCVLFADSCYRANYTLQKSSADKAATQT
ncbi:hypothetical protein SARC_17098, partial [Sphaeroforma arctica JP610]